MYLPGNILPSDSTKKTKGMYSIGNPESGWQIPENESDSTKSGVVHYCLSSFEFLDPVILDHCGPDCKLFQRHPRLSPLGLGTEY